MAVFRQYSGSDYADLLGRLLPRGPLFRVFVRSRLRALLEAFGNELARLNAAADFLRMDSWPGTCDSGSVDDWSAALAMTEAQKASESTLREQMEQKLVRVGGSNPAALVDQVKSVFGVDISVQEFENEFFEAANVFYWWISFPGGEPDAETSQAIVAFLESIKPAHTVLFIGSRENTVIEPGRGELSSLRTLVIDAGRGGLNECQPNLIIG